MESNFILSFAMVGLLGLVCQWVAWRLRLPAILFLERFKQGLATIAQATGDQFGNSSHYGKSRRGILLQ